MFWRSRRRVAPRQVSAYRLSGHLRGVLRRRILGTQPVDLKTALTADAPTVATDSVTTDVDAVDSESVE